ncbi:hypothetical protein [Bradyrhizobium sacchari]|uniref:hypothetical protein n=1 Tax=Bradyrhizobium sacchari TaxID=1399419 RepID=UPI00137481F4|nr:hypothetical protein [Bradyrhizobium sacchari]
MIYGRVGSVGNADGLECSMMNEFGRNEIARTHWNIHRDDAWAGDARCNWK